MSHSRNETPTRRNNTRDESQFVRQRRNLFPGNGHQTTSGKCSPWISRTGDELQITTPQVLRRSDIAAHEFINFVTILGPARQGKSFLLNCLVGDNVFGTTDTIGVCTKGVQLSNVVQRVKNKGCALFVDTEGQGDEDIDSDTTLLTPVLLLSKVILFNWKGGLQKNKILDELAILVEVGNSVSSSSFEEDSSKFGHLHIVLRDFHFQGTVGEAFEMIFKQEEKRGEKVRERNKIREKLQSSFESIDISIFPAPCEELNDLGDLQLEETSDEFQESVQQLKDKILLQVNEPRQFGNIVVTSNNAEILLEKFVEELETGDVVHLKSVVGQLQHRIVDDAKRLFEENLVEAFGQVDVPVKDKIEDSLVQERDALLEEFLEKTAKIDLEIVYRDEVYEKLEEFSDREIEAKRRENQLAIQFREAEEKEILAEAVEEFRRGVENELRNNGKQSGEMRRSFDRRKQRLVDEFLKKTNVLGWISEQVKEELIKLERWSSERLVEKIRAKQNEEEHVEKSEQLMRLSGAAEDFRSGVEGGLRRNQGTSVRSLRENFQAERERLVMNFLKSTDRLHHIPEQVTYELERLNTWSSTKLEEKVKEVEEKARIANERAKAERERAQEIEKARAAKAAYEKEVKEMEEKARVANERAKADRERAQAIEAQAAREAYEGEQRRVLQALQQPSYMGAQSVSDPFQSYQSAFDPFSVHTPFSPQSYSPVSSSHSRVSPPQTSNLTFYKGGQFTPGGGRAPVGGCYTSPTPSPTGGSRFYKGGQFTPGGGRAPAGGCYMRPTPSSSSSLSSTSGGTRFYKGGQFLSGGGRAPKGGCRR